MVENIITREITEPKYMDYQEIKDIYWDNWVLMSDTDGLDGGIVRYTSNSRNPLHDIQHKKIYHDTVVMYIGDIKPIGGMAVIE
jgi:hypothetical protein